VISHEHAVAVIEPKPHLQSSRAVLDVELGELDLRLDHEHVVFDPHLVQLDAAHLSRAL
jgi:hypothetical protein